MQHRFFFAGLALTIAASIVFDIGIQLPAGASNSEPTILEIVSHEDSRKQPIVFARFKKKDLSLFVEPQSPLHCEQSDFFQNAKTAHTTEEFVDSCAPIPSLITPGALKKTNDHSWELPFAPERIVWQHHVTDGRILTLDIIDSDNLPWPARFESSKLGDLETVQAFATYELQANRDMFLIAKVVESSGEIVENWILPLRLKNGNTASVPWSAK